MQDKPTQYQLPPKDLICGYVFHDTNDPNHGETLKIQWFLSNGICTDIHLLASCGKDNLKKFCWDLDGKKYRIVKFSVLIDKKDYSCRKTWMTPKWMERTEYGSHVEEIDATGRT